MSCENKIYSYFCNFQNSKFISVDVMQPDYIISINQSILSGIGSTYIWNLALGDKRSLCTVDAQNVSDDKDTIYTHSFYYKIAPYQICMAPVISRKSVRQVVWPQLNRIVPIHLRDSSFIIYWDTSVGVSLISYFPL